MSTCTRLDLQTLGSQPVIMPNNLLDHWFKPSFGVDGWMNGLGGGNERWWRVDFIHPEEVFKVEAAKSVTPP